MSDYTQGSVTVSSTITHVVEVSAENDGVLIQNTGSATVYLGGSSLTASGATQGISLAANTTILIPSLGGFTHSLFAITASSTSTVNYLLPAAN